MPILIIAVVCLVIFLVMGVLAVSAVRKELRAQRELEQQQTLVTTHQH
jgi:Tfp pilus assembly protein PilV